MRFSAHYMEVTAPLYSQRRFRRNEVMRVLVHHDLGRRYCFSALDASGAREAPPFWPLNPARLVIELRRAGWVVDVPHRESRVPVKVWLVVGGMLAFCGLAGPTVIFPAIVPGGVMIGTYFRQRDVESVASPGEPG